MNFRPNKIFAIITLLGLANLTPTMAETNKPLIKGSEHIVVANKGFKTPESIEYYEDEDVYLVSNINGSAIKPEGNGFISKIKPDGSIIQLKWIDGTQPGVQLNSPKGMAIQGGNLYIADINQVHIFDLPSGKQKTSVTIKGSTFLNGITPGNGGFVYVTDSGLGTDTPANTHGIYKVTSKGNYSSIIKDKKMGRPNGIVTNKKELIFVTFGSGEVFRIDLKGKGHSMPSPPKGALDGLLKLIDGRLVLSSWDGSALYVLNTDYTYSILADSLDAPADLGFDTKRQRILVPLFKLDKLVFLPL